MKYNARINCPFCNEEIKNHLFLESENFIAIYNNSPVLPGHSLIVPKKHVETLLELSDEETYEFVCFSKDVARLLMDVFKTNSFNWVIQEKEEAGATIPHLHMHIIPRKKNDFPDPGDWYPTLMESQKKHIDSKDRPTLKPLEMQKIVKKLRKAAKKR